MSAACPQNDVGASGAFCARPLLWAVRARKTHGRDWRAAKRGTPMTCATVLNIAGLLMNLAGVILLFFS
jgi:hypothetical protein